MHRKHPLTEGWHGWALQGPREGQELRVVRRPLADTTATAWLLSCERCYPRDGEAGMLGSSDSFSSSHVSARRKRPRLSFLGAWVQHGIPWTGASESIQRKRGFKACLGAHLHLLFPSVPLSPRPDCRVVVDAGSFSFRFILEVLSCARSRRRLALAAFPPSTLPSVHFHFAFASISIYSPFCYTHPFTRSASCCTSSLPSRQVL